MTATHSVHIEPLNLTHGEAKSGHKMCLCPYIDSLLLKYCLEIYIKAFSFLLEKLFFFPVLGAEPRAMRPASQHYTTELSRSPIHFPPSVWEVGFIFIISIFVKCLSFFSNLKLGLSMKLREGQGCHYLNKMNMSVMPLLR